MSTQFCCGLPGHHLPPLPSIALFCMFISPSMLLSISGNISVSDQFVISWPVFAEPKAPRRFGRATPPEAPGPRWAGEKWPFRRRAARRGSRELGKQSGLIRSMCPLSSHRRPCQSVHLFAACCLFAPHLFPVCRPSICPSVLLLVFQYQTMEALVPWNNVGFLCTWICCSSSISQLHSQDLYLNKQYLIGWCPLCPLMSLMFSYFLTATQVRTSTSMQFGDAGHSKWMDSVNLSVFVHQAPL